MVKMGTLQVRLRFGAVKNLALYISLCITYIDCCIKGIFFMDRKIVAIHSTPVPTLDRDRYLSEKRSILSHKASSLGLQVHATILFTNWLTALANMEHPPIVTTFRHGLMSIQVIQTENPTKRLLLAPGLCEGPEHVPFRIVMANFSKSSETIPKICWFQPALSCQKRY